jgi:hypothetical protein
MGMVWLFFGMFMLMLFSVVAPGLFLAVLPILVIALLSFFALFVVDMMRSSIGLKDAPEAIFGFAIVRNTGKNKPFIVCSH